MCTMLSTWKGGEVDRDFKLNLCLEFSVAV